MEPLESNIASKIVFPPFPPAPPGSTIIPFKNFREHGIRVAERESGQEIDGAGVPTVILPIREEPDFDFGWEPRQPPVPPGPRSGDRKLWWEYWSENDNKRRPFLFNSNQPRLDRIYSALSSFRGSRRWPFERDGKPGPTYFWAQFRIFIGVSGYPPAWNRTDKPKPKEALESTSPDYSDGESDKKPSKRPASADIQLTTNFAPNIGRQNDGPARPPYAYFNVRPVDINGDEAVRELLELDKLRREERLIDFLEDPEKATRTFLSSYSRNQGFWWSNDNLDLMSRVLCFFFRFLLKNRVFPDAKDERKLQNALRIAESGHKELPLTSIIVKFLPDQFGIACRVFWGQRSKHTEWSDDENDDTRSEAEDNKVHADILVSDGAGLSSRITKISFDESEDGSDPSVVVPPEPQARPASVPKPIPQVFKSLFSSTNLFPASHTLGVVEQSLRRIKHVLPPGSFVSTHAKSYKPGSPDAPVASIDAIEHDLETKLAKIILIPWTGSGLNGYDSPEILRRPENFPVENQTLKDGLDEHDPFEDEIAVLVSVKAKQLDLLKDAVGMGISGTWVQIRPVGEEGLNSRRLKFWFLEENNLVVPSFETC
ncbi:hypothetical protein D9756_003741 [Leucocoprinus leucothites]|uniref:Uncharacterized protein n=1 Tax=Leucocoprinus leucothites TaxID=201217 RepID=A0A8H5D8S7_9AGAR|nr:hypothetical protein D9756_003741 [Leucoagaricus leucothites]